MSSLSTHVVDASRGVSAAGVQVELYGSTAPGWDAMAEGITDQEGRIATLAAELPPGGYRLVFATAAYFARSGGSCFFPEVVVSFIVDDERHYHVPLLLSPYAYSVCRGN